MASDNAGSGAKGSPSAEELLLRICELEKRMTLHMTYQADAVEKAANELRIRLASMNEFRDTLRDQAGKFCTTNVLDERTQALHDRISNLHKDIENNFKRVTQLELYRANLDGRFWIWGVVLIIIMMLIQLYPILKH